jgi:hypothetical protein
MGVSLGEARETDHLEEFRDALSASISTLETKTDVALDRQVRKEVALLRHVANTSALGLDEVRVVVDHVAAQAHAPSVATLEPGDDSQERRLATARWSQDRHEGTGRDLEV